MNSMSKDIRSLSQKQRILLEQRLQEKRKQIRPNTIIPKRSNGTLPPLSFAQQRLWFLSQLYPESALYNILMPFRLSGSLDIATLENALNTIVARHEMLRTTFQFIDGQLVQTIDPEFRPELVHIDLHELPDHEREKLVHQIVLDEAIRPFDLSNDPLIRLKLLLLQKQEYVFLLSLHHAISDGWSTGVLFEEIAALYQAGIQGKQATLPELPIQYADYAIWQQQWLDETRTKNLLAYWTSQLNNLPVLQLASDYPPPTHPKHLGGAQDFSLSEDLSKQILQCCSQQHVTLFMFFLTTFLLLLFRYSHQDDIAVGIPIVNRPSPELEHLIGFFTNTLVFRTSMKGNPSFKSLLARVSEIALDGYTYQDLPFEKLVEVLRPQRDLSHNPLFQVMFNQQKQKLDRLSLPGISIKPIEIHKGTALFDLTLDIVEEATHFIGRFEYNRELFAPLTIQRMAKSFQTLLEALIADLEQPILEVPLLSTEDRQTLLIDWNATKKNYPLNCSYTQLFEEQVEREPEAIALVFKSEHLTYRELNARANQLAHHLRRRGVGPEIRVGVYMERSPEMIICLLAILKAGGAYVPLDPAYPKERLQFMLDDAAPPILLTQQNLMQQQELQAPDILYIASSWETFQQEQSENLIPQANAQNLAYVVYTSGSTGRPKGVLITHRSLINHNLAIIDRCRFSQSDRIFQFYSISFDASVEEIFPTFLCGAQLILRDNNLLLSGADLAHIIEQEAISLISLPTAYWHVWVYELEQGNYKLPDSLRMVLLSGEKPSSERLMKWLQLGKSSCMNTYGPTEVTITQTLFEPGVDQQRAEMAGEVPIGRPIANTQIYLLDNYFQPIPLGVIGEIYIGGEGLARGYLNHPDLTAKIFVPDPFSKEEGRRLYRTGDYGRYLPDGNLQVFGRIDHQIKLHGFRVEPGEVEAVLGQYPGVRQVVVLAQDDAQGDKHLVAYVAADTRITIDQLRPHLKKYLPYYMVPAYFVMLETIPFTPNGKVDHKALPHPTMISHQGTASYVAPRSDIEQQIAHIWHSVLNVEHISIHDNFFDSGGHSLSLVKLHQQIQAHFGTNFSLVEMYRHPTINSLADYLLQTTTLRLSIGQQKERNELQREAILRRKQQMRKRLSRQG